MGGLASCLAFNIFECALCAGCSCMSLLLNFGFSKATRVGHLLIVLLTFIFAIILGVHFPNEIRHYQDQLGLNPVQDCPWYADCRYDTYLQLIYRASFGLSLCFSLLAITTYFFEVVDKSMWLMKFGMAIGSFIGCCYFTNDVALNWAEVARYVSFLWLIVQGLIYLDFAHDVHDALMAFAEDTMRERGSANGTYGFYIFLSVGLLVCCGTGLGRLFIIAQHNKEDMYFAVITLVTGVLFTGISILNMVKKGLLTPCIVFTYSVFLNLSASCLTLPENKALAVVSGVLSLTVLLYSIINGTTILNVFDPQAEGLLMGYTDASLELNLVRTGTGSSEEAPVLAGPSQRKEMNTSSAAFERSFFHIVLVLFCSFSAMVLTAWRSTKLSYGDVSSTWLIIVAQWIFVAMFFKMLHVAYINERDN